MKKTKTSIRTEETSVYVTLQELFKALNIDEPKGDFDIYIRGIDELIHFDCGFYDREVGVRVDMIEKIEESNGQD
jgi:hypothetical protein